MSMDTTVFGWYMAADDQMNDYATATSIDFGTGKTNTATMIAKWNASEYGEQNYFEEDIWGLIQEEVAEGWFVPSICEWSAFGRNLNITFDNYSDYSLDQMGYWSSSQATERYVYTVRPDNTGGVYQYTSTPDDMLFVRLSATF